MSSSNQDDYPTAGLVVVFATVVLVLVSVFSLTLMRAPHHLEDQFGPDLLLGKDVTAPPGETWVDVSPEGLPLLTVHFRADQVRLPTGYQALFAPTLKVMLGDARKVVLLSVFHAVGGERSQAAALARERARVVRAFLLARGVAPEQVLLHRPQTTLADAGSAEAHRVELRLIDRP